MPDGKQLPQFWEDNNKALMEYMFAVSLHFYRSVEDYDSIGTAQCLLGILHLIGVLGIRT